MTTKTTTTIRTRVAAAAGGAAIAAAALMAAGTGAAGAAPVDSVIPQAGSYTVKLISPVPLGPTIVAPLGELPASVSEDGVLTVAGHSGKLRSFHNGQLGDGARTTIAGVPVVLWTVPEETDIDRHDPNVYIVDVAGNPNAGNLVRN